MKRVLLFTAMFYFLIDELIQPIIYKNFTFLYYNYFIRKITNTNDYFYDDTTSINKTLFDFTYNDTYTNTDPDKMTTQNLIYKFMNIEPPQFSLNGTHTVSYLTVNTIDNKNHIIDIYSFYITLWFLMGYFLTTTKTNLITIIMSIIYFKYLLTNIIYFRYMPFFLSKLRRGIIWLFTTPLILIHFCTINELPFWSVGFHWHIAANILYIYSLYLEENKMNFEFYTITALIYITESVFVLKIYNFSGLKYTQIICYIWILFFIINIIDLSHIYKDEYIHVFYSLSDMLCKITTIFIITDNENQINKIIDAIDLESIKMIYKLKHELREFENTKLTEQNKIIVDFIKNTINSIIPKDNTNLKLTLLKKILPFNFDNTYLIFEKINHIKKHKDICVFFSDIVSYTELANKYDDMIIFELLHNVYKLFDSLVSKYAGLQKIETIGDAYMIVGDLYHIGEKSEKHLFNIIMQMIKIGIEFIQRIKKINFIKTEELSIRVGIYLGNVAVGILGNDIPRMSVVGNAVNVAARMQSTAETDTIQIPENIYEIIQRYITPAEEVAFKFTRKENVYMKNVGYLTTYLVESCDSPRMNERHIIDARIVT